MNFIYGFEILSLMNGNRTNTIQSCFLKDCIIWIEQFNFLLKTSFNRIIKGYCYTKKFLWIDKKNFWISNSPTKMSVKSAPKKCNFGIENGDFLCFRADVATKFV